MEGVCPPKVSIVCGLWIQVLLNQSPKCFWNCLWSLFETTRCALKTVSLVSRVDL